MAGGTPSVTIVVAGRNDDYGGDFRERLFRTAAHNVALFEQAGLTWEYLLVEWNPLSDRRLLSDEFIRIVPGSRAIVVPPPVHAAWSLQDSMPFHEMPAKNAGIRRARAPWVIVTNADVLFGPEVITRLAHGALDDRRLYRARRIDVKPECTWDAMQDPANQLPSGEGSTAPVEYLGAGGDFCLASRALWHELRGFDERIRFSTRAKDWQFFLSARERGIPIEFIGSVFHLDHAGGFRNTPVAERRSPKAHFGGPWDVEFGLPTLNPANWGLGDLETATSASGESAMGRRVETIHGVPDFPADEQRAGEQLRAWLTDTEPDWLTASWLHAIFGAWRARRALRVRLETPRVAARLQGFLGVAGDANLEIRGSWPVPALEGFTSTPPAEDDAAVPEPGVWMLAEREGGLYRLPDASGEPAQVGHSWSPAHRPPVEPPFNPLLARRLLRAWIELETRGARRVLIYGAGSHTHELLAFGWPDGQEIAGIVTTQGDATRFGDLPIRSLASVDLSEADAIVISSATYEPEMAANARAAGFAHVVTLYESWPRRAPSQPRARARDVRFGRPASQASGFTVAIAARNAASTIRRAILSVRDQCDALLLVDDGSTDDTVAIARDAARGAITVVNRVSSHGGPLGATRQAGLDRVETPFAAWLDADDEFMPGRVGRLIAALHAGADVVADATTLVDGGSGRVLRDVPLPEWAHGAALPARLFERNPLPAIGLVGFRTSVWRRLGYDPTLHGAEDVDILLRGLAARVRFGWVLEPGTRVHVYPSSLSRQRDAQRAGYARALRKHTYEDVRSLYRDAGWLPGVTAAGLASMAMFREEPRRVLDFLDEAERADGQQTWRMAFMRATALLLLGEHDEAIRTLRVAEDLDSRPEGANNLGVALARAGRLEEARCAFSLSVSQRPDYEDARINLTADVPTRITTHLLR